MSAAVIRRAQGTGVGMGILGLLQLHACTYVINSSLVDGRQCSTQSRATKASALKLYLMLLLLV